LADEKSRTDHLRERQSNMNKISVRLAASDAKAIATIANALRTEKQPFVTRSAALKFALAAVAANPHRFIANAAEAA
jgi:hypothetical protein